MAEAMLKAKVSKFKKRPLPQPIMIKEESSSSDSDSGQILFPKFENNACLVCGQWPQNTKELIKHMEGSHGIKRHKDFLMDTVFQCRRCPKGESPVKTGTEVNGMALFLAHVTLCGKADQKMKRKLKTEESESNPNTSRKRLKKLDLPELSPVVTLRGSRRLEEKRIKKTEESQPSSPPAAAVPIKPEDTTDDDTIVVEPIRKTRQRKNETIADDRFCTTYDNILFGDLTVNKTKEEVQKAPELTETQLEPVQQTVQKEDGKVSDKTAEKIEQAMGKKFSRRNSILEPIPEAKSEDESDVFSKPPEKERAKLEASQNGPGHENPNVTNVVNKPPRQPKKKQTDGLEKLPTGSLKEKLPEQRPTGTKGKMEKAPDTKDIPKQSSALDSKSSTGEPRPIQNQNSRFSFGSNQNESGMNPTLGQRSASIPNLSGSMVKVLREPNSIPTFPSNSNLSASLPISAPSQIPKFLAKSNLKPTYPTTQAENLSKPSSNANRMSTSGSNQFGSQKSLIPTPSLNSSFTANLTGKVPKIPKKTKLNSSAEGMEPVALSTPLDFSFGSAPRASTSSNYMGSTQNVSNTQPNSTSKHRLSVPSSRSSENRFHDNSTHTPGGTFDSYNASMDLFPTPESVKKSQPPIKKSSGPRKGGIANAASTPTLISTKPGTSLLNPTTKSEVQSSQSSIPAPAVLDVNNNSRKSVKRTASVTFDSPPRPFPQSTTSYPWNFSIDNNTMDTKTPEVPMGEKGPKQRAKWSRTPTPAVGRWHCRKCNANFSVQKFYMLHTCGRLKAPVKVISPVLVQKTKRPKVMLPKLIQRTTALWK